MRKCVTMDLKEPGNLLYLIGSTKDELGGSHAYLVSGRSGGGVPQVDLASGAKKCLPPFIRPSFKDWSGRVTI